MMQPTFFSNIKQMALWSFCFYCFAVPGKVNADDCFDDVIQRNFSANYNLRELIEDMADARNSSQPDQIRAIGQDPGTSISLIDEANCIVQVQGSGAVHFLKETSFTVFDEDGNSLMYTDLRLDRLTDGWKYSITSGCPLTDDDNLPDGAEKASGGIRNLENMGELTLSGSNYQDQNYFAFIPTTNGQNLVPGGPPEIFMLEPGTYQPYIRDSVGFTQASANSQCKYELIYRALVSYPFLSGYMAYNGSVMSRQRGSIPSWDPDNPNQPDDYTHWEDADYLCSTCNSGSGPIIIFDPKSITHYQLGEISSCAAAGDTTMQVAALTNLRVGYLGYQNDFDLQNYEYETRQVKCVKKVCIGFELDLGPFGSICFGRKVCVEYEITWHPTLLPFNNVDLYYNSKTHEMMNLNFALYVRELSMGLDEDRRLKDPFGAGCYYSWRSFLPSNKRPELSHPPDFCGVMVAEDPEDLDQIDFNNLPPEVIAEIPDDLLNMKILVAWAGASHPSESNPFFAPDENEDDNRIIKYHVYQSTSSSNVFDNEVAVTTQKYYAANDGVVAGTTYYFGVRAEDRYGKFDENNIVLSAVYSSASGAPYPAGSTYLWPAYPNPFREKTLFKIFLAKPAPVHLDIYNVAGQKVKTLLDGPLLMSGAHFTVWDGKNNAGEEAASGMYFYRLEADEFRDTKKIILLH